MASSIVKSSAQRLGKLLVEEATSLYDVRDKIESLQEEMERMGSFLRDADTKQHHDRLVRNWVSEIQDLAYEAEDIIVRYLKDVSQEPKDDIKNTPKRFSCIIYSGDTGTLHDDLGSDIVDLTIKLSELASKLQRYGIQIISPAKTLEYNTVTRVDVIGFDDDLREVVQKLVNGEMIVVGICGIVGLGKTTLARKVFEHKDVRDHFNDNCVWVYISKEFYAESIFQDIFLGLVKGDTYRLKGKQLIGGIRNLVRVKRCLIVLDGIWSIDSWERLKPAFESLQGTSSKILLTSRNISLLEHVDLPRYTHFLNTLIFDSSWELLHQKAFNKHGKDEEQVMQNAETKNEMEKIGKEMVKHCSGLPIAILALGGILSTKNTISEWKEVQQNLSYLISDTDQPGGSRTSQILEVLELSYHELPYYLKPCFLYFGYFPEDDTISTEKLYQLWEAEGFLVVRQGGRMYDIGESYLNELVERTMVEIEDYWEGSGYVKTCRVRDIMRDMCLKKCEEVGFLNHIHCPKADVALTRVKKLRRCVLHDQHGDNVFKQFENDSKGGGARSILLLESEMPSKIWTSCPLLRVLFLEGTPAFFREYGIEQLIHLRYLSLRNSGTMVFSSFGFRYDLHGLYDLKYLETLDLRLDVEVRLENKLYEMKNLRHLYLPKWFICESGRLRIPAERMETLKNIDPSQCALAELMQMENLRVFSIKKDYVFSDKWTLKVLLEAPVMQVSAQLVNSFPLRIRRKVIDELEPKTLIILLAHHPCFNQVSIAGFSYQKTRMIQDKNIFGDSLTRVELDCIISSEEVSALEKLPLLKILRLDTKDKRVSFSAGSFPKLAELTLLTDDLEELVIGDGALPSLQRLELSHCKNLTAEVNNFPKTLTEVKIGYCVIGCGLFVALEQLPCLHQLDLHHPLSQGNQISLSTGSFPQLFQLSIMVTSEKMEELEFGDGALPNLQSLELYDCVMMKALMNLPHSLTQVKLGKCGISEGMIVSLGKLPLLQILKLNHCKEVCRKMSFHPMSFPRLKELSIHSVSELEEIEVGDGSLPNLKRLELWRCEKLKRIPGGLPDSVEIECYSPCINGIENYNTCHYFVPPVAVPNPYDPMRCFR